jgi:hypothetical protein
LDQIDSSFEYCHQIATVHEDHDPATGRMSLHAVFGETVDREEQQRDRAGRLEARGVTVVEPDQGPRTIATL